MKYGIDLTISGYIEVEADSKEEAKAKIEEGYSLSDVEVMNDEIDEVCELTPDGRWPVKK